MNEWVKGLRVDIKANLIYAWDNNSVCFYYLQPELGNPQGKLV
jgi:hypothetical protein